MKKIIAGKVYDTSLSKLILKRTYGVFGDPEGYEEALYQTEDGSYFLYANGGENSEYKTESIKRMSEKNAQRWLSSQS